MAPAKSDETREISFGPRLRRFREAAGLTQEELAAKSGLSVKAISALERGARRRPYPHTVRSLVRALNLSEEQHASLLSAVPRRSDAATERPAEISRFALPAPPTPLIGRDREVSEILGVLSGTRLLTLTGPGGVGKSSLALRVARDAAASFPDGAAFVALAALDDHNLVIPTVAQALGVQETEGQTPLEDLSSFLRESQLLLVLDNFEQLLDAAPEVAALVEGSADLAVLTTSRAPLRVRGEREYPVRPLGLPSSTINPSAGEVVGSASGQLFVDRARAVSPSFDLVGEDAAAVAAICWRLAGLPLALELAAARTRFIDPKGLLSRLDAALSAGWARDVPERQRTMRATLDWSHDLLSDPEQRLFRRVSVFAGGFTLPAAEAVGAVEGAEGPLSLIGSLVEQSLVTVELPAEGGARYGMLEPIRQYAAWRLETDGGVADARRRHAAFYLELAEKAHPELRGPRQVEWLDRLDRENGNLRATVGWALSENEFGIAGRLLWALWVFWLLRGHHGEGRRWAEALLERDLPAELSPRALHVAAAMAYTQGDYEACEGYAAKALDLSITQADTPAEAYARCELGLAAMNRGDLGVAVSRFEEALPLLLRSGEEGAVPPARAWLGTALLLRGDQDRAIPILEQGLEQARMRGDRIGAYRALYNLARVALSRDDHELATRMLEEGVALSEEMRDRTNLSYFLEGLAEVAAIRGQAGRSARLLGASEGLLRTVGASAHNFAPDRSLHEHAAAGLRSRLGEIAYEEARAEGRTMTFEQAVALALHEVY